MRKRRRKKKKYYQFATTMQNSKVLLSPEDVSPEGLMEFFLPKVSLPLTLCPTCPESSPVRMAEIPYFLW